MSPLEKIYRLYFTDVYFFILSLSKNKDIAEEITSETFFKLLKSYHSIEKEESIKSFLLTMAKHTYFDYLKKKKRIVSDIDEVKLEDPTENPEELQLKNETIFQMQEAISTLNEDDQKIVKMRIYAEWSFREIAQYFSKTENWACVKFHRAKQKLKKILEEKHG